MSKYVETADVIHPSLYLILHVLFTIICGDPLLSYCVPKSLNI